jgi:serine/threonine protein kinase
MIHNALNIGYSLKGAVLYTIAEPLHSGGFGITYRATAQIMVGNIPQTATFTIKEFFMSKICSRDADGSVVVATENQQAFKYAKADFKTEAEILHSLKHDNIVPVNEVFEQNNTVYYVMSYLGNISLYQYVAENGGALQESQAKDIILPLTSALAYLHNRNILHLDIKPDNIMMVRHGNTIKPVLIDFGQAMYFVNGKPKKDKGIRGYSKGYSPLQLKQNVSTFSPSLDIYSLAATLLYMLSGVDPCDAEELSTHKIYKTLPESVSQNTMDAIICGLQKEAVSRPNDIASFQNILEYGIPSTTNSSSSNNTGDGRIPTDPIIPDSPKPISTKLIAIACVAVVSLGGWFAWNKFNKNEGGNATEHSANNDTQQSQKKDTTSVIADSLMPEHVDIKEHVAKTSKKDEQKQSNKSEEKIEPADSHKPTSIPSPKHTLSPKSGTVNLGYATWKGELLNGKPYGNGTMMFHRSHAVSGCYMTPQAGDYIIGYCQNGVIQNGALYRDGEKIETIIR